MKKILISISLAVLVVLSAFLLVSCTSTDALTEVPEVHMITSEEEANEIKTVVVEHHEFHPADLDIKVGDTVQWVNKDGVDYTINFLNYNLVTELIDGASFVHTFHEAGDFTYVSHYHHDENGQEDDPEHTKILQGTIHVSE